MYSWEGLFVVTLTDTDIIRASWLDPDDEFCSGCWNFSQCHHKHSLSGLHSPGQSYFANSWYGSWVQTFHKITTGLNFNFYLRPTFTQKALRTAVAVYEFRVTRNCFWAGFLWKSVSFRVILLKIVHKHAGIYSSIIKLLFPGIILWLCWPNIFFSLLLCPTCLLPKIPRSWRCWMVIPKENIVSTHLRGACVMKQKKQNNTKQRFNESLVVIWLYWMWDLRK